jgi:hypothetical protein
MHHWYVLMIAVGMRLCTNVKVCFGKELGDVTLGTICRNEKSSAATYHEDVALSRNMHAWCSPGHVNLVLVDIMTQCS